MNCRPDDRPLSMLRLLPVVVGLGLLASVGCGGEESVQSGGPAEHIDASGDVTVIVPNSSGTVEAGTPQRMLVALLSVDGSGYVGGPSIDRTLRFAEMEGEGQIEAAGVWRSVQDRVGMYVATVEFERPGMWEVAVFDGDRELGGALFEVVADSAVPNIGEPVPLSDTPTVASVGPAGLTAISSDAEPDPDLYQLTVAEAATNGRPTLVAFATPLYCRTALCGPTLDVVKTVVAKRPNVDVIHVEPFDLDQAAAGDLVPNEIAQEWGLPTEPWVFVLDSEGRVAARFEGLITAADLAEALDGL